MSREISEVVGIGWRRWLPFLLLVVALALGALGQREFGYDPPHIRNGLILFILGGISLVASRLSWRPAMLAESSARTVGTRGAATATAGTSTAPLWRWVISLAGVLLLAWVVRGIIAREQRSSTSPTYALLFTGWVISVLLVSGAWLLPERWGPREGMLQRLRSREWLRERQWVLLSLGAIILLAAWLRLDNLAFAPFTMSGDEGSIGMDVQRVLDGTLTNPFTLVWGPHPSLLSFLLAPSLRLFGETLWAIRLPNAIFGILSVPALYWLGRLVAGRGVALASALLLATFPMHLHYSRVSPIVLDSLLFTGALASLFYAMRRARPAMWPFVLAAILGGLDQYVYTGSRLLPVIVVGYVFYHLLMERERVRERAHQLVVTALVFLVVAAPIFLYGLRHPDEFNARINQIGIVQSGWLESEMEARGEGALPILWDQFRRSLFGYAFFDDRTETWGPGTPLAHPLLGLGLFLGLAVSLRRWREPELVALHLWFWGVVIGAGTLTLAPPTSNRVVSITPVVALLAAMGWRAMTGGLSRARPRHEQPYVAMLLFVACIAATAYSGALAHRRYLADNRFGGPNALIGTVVGYDLQTREDGTTLVMVGAPRLYSGISPLVYLAPDNPKFDINEPLTAPPPGYTEEGDLLFVVVPERAGEIPFILDAYPSARTREVKTPGSNEVLYHEVFVDR